MKVEELIERLKHFNMNSDISIFISDYDEKNDVENWKEAEFLDITSQHEECHISLSLLD